MNSKATASAVQRSCVGDGSRVCKCPSSLMDTTTKLEEQRLLLGALGLGVHIHLAMML